MRPTDLVFFPLYSYRSNPRLLNHNEVVALFNTFNRLSESLEAIQKFRKMYADRLAPPPSSHQRQLAQNVGDWLKWLLDGARTMAHKLIKLGQLPVPSFLDDPLDPLDPL
jgi:hypothetical protein